MADAPETNMEVFGDQAVEHAFTTSAYLMCMSFIDKVLRGEDRPKDPKDRTLSVSAPEGNTALAMKLLETSNDAIMLVKDDDMASERGGGRKRVYAAASDKLKRRKCDVAVVDDASGISDSCMVKTVKALESCQPVYILIG